MFDDLESAFSELDKRPFADIARSLASYRKALMDQGFTRREALNLVQNFSKFLYEWALEEMLTKDLPDSDPPQET